VPANEDEATTDEVVDIVDDVLEDDTGTSTAEVFDEDAVIVEEEDSDEPDSGVDETEDVVSDEEESEDIVVDETLVPEEENLIAVNAVTNDENLYSFSRDECTLVGD